MDRAPPIVKSSKFWGALNKEPLKQLDLEGFKTSVARDYFTFSLHRSDPQFRFLHSNIGKHRMILALIQTLFSSKFAHESKKKSLTYIYLTRLLWEYISHLLPPHLLEIEEPRIGNPLLVKWKNRQVTQDLAHSLLEFHTIMTSMATLKIKTILELGAGYGRLAYVFLKNIPSVKYLIADIPPALFVSQSYLSRVFADQKIFRFRPFTKFEEIQQEFEEARICFLLPHQLELLAPQSIDLGISISSLHEMTCSQTSYYFSQFDRLISGYFYFKQWKEFYLPLEKITIVEADYQVPPDWEEIFWHTCPVQTLFFEALFKT